MRTRTIGDVRIEITDDCIGSAQCVALAPAVFHLDDDGYASVSDDMLGVQELTRAKEAEDVCPMGAIRVSKLSAAQREK